MSLARRPEVERGKRRGLKLRASGFGFGCDQSSSCRISRGWGLVSVRLADYEGRKRRKARRRAESSFVPRRRRHLDLAHLGQHPQLDGGGSGVPWLLAFEPLRLVRGGRGGMDQRQRRADFDASSFRFGAALHDTTANFQALVTALHNAGMALMVDIVVNDGEFARLAFFCLPSVRVASVLATPSALDLEF